MKYVSLLFSILVLLFFIGGCISQEPTIEKEVVNNSKNIEKEEIVEDFPVINDSKEEADTSEEDENGETTSQYTEEQTEEQNNPQVWNSKGVAISGKYGDAEAIAIENGKYRIYYGSEPEIDGFEGQVYSSISSDGINWIKEEGTRITWAIFPSLLKLQDGTYRMYFQNEQVIKSATSQNGLSWNNEEKIRIDASNNAGLDLENVAAPTVIEVKGEDYKYMMVYRGTIQQKYSDNVPNSNTQLFLWAVSEDGISFEKKGIALDSRNSEFLGLLDGPELVEWEDGTIRLYFWSYKGSYHTTFDGVKFSEETIFDFTTESESKGPFPENPPCDPTLIKINNTWFMYYGQHTKGIYYAILEN